MIILIAKQNQDIIKEILPRVKFYDHSKSTCTFTLGPSKFELLYNEVKLRGYNPFALMYWRL